jgi:predicted XRE-type DNA-binding protein
MRKKKKVIKLVKSSGNFFKDVGVKEPLAAKLKLKSHLALVIVSLLQKKYKTQREMAKAADIHVVMMNHLMKGDIDKISLDKLLIILHNLNQKPYPKIAKLFEVKK